MKKLINIVIVSVLVFGFSSIAGAFEFYIGDRDGHHHREYRHHYNRHYDHNRWNRHGYYRGYRGGYYDGYYGSRSYYYYPTYYYPRCEESRPGFYIKID